MLEARWPNGQHAGVQIELSWLYPWLGLMCCVPREETLASLQPGSFIKCVSELNAGSNPVIGSITSGWLGVEILLIILLLQKLA